MCTVVFMAHGMGGASAFSASGERPAGGKAAAGLGEPHGEPGGVTSRTSESCRSVRCWDIVRSCWEGRGREGGGVEGSPMREALYAASSGLASGGCHGCPPPCPPSRMLGSAHSTALGAAEAADGSLKVVAVLYSTTLCPECDDTACKTHSGVEGQREKLTPSDSACLRRVLLKDKHHVDKLAAEARGGRGLGKLG